MVSFSVAPRWVIPPPKEVSIESGQLLHLKCVPEGRPTPIVTWTKIASNIELNTYSFPNGSLIITNISKSHEGEYVCNASNKIGLNIDNVVKIHVIGKNMGICSQSQSS